MWSFRSWRVSTWLIVLWSGFWAFVAVSMIWSTFTGAACAGNEIGTPASCQGWIGLLLVFVLFLMFLVWLGGMGVLIVVRAIGWRRGHGGPGGRNSRRGTPRGYCLACGAKVADVRETCPQCGHSPQESYDSWQSTP
jgi:hypothetical protein